MWRSSRVGCCYNHNDLEVETGALQVGEVRRSKRQEIMNSDEHLPYIHVEPPHAVLGLSTLYVTSHGGISTATTAW